MRTPAKITMRLSFLSLLPLVIILSGCNDQYAIEKKFWNVQKQAENIFKNSDASPPQQLKKAVARLESFVQQYPRTALAVECDFTIANLYTVKKEYPSAIKQLNTIVSKHPKAPVICAKAIYLIGNVYQIQDKWAQALEQYKKIIENYPNTPRGLSIPIYIAQYYRLKYQPEKMLEAYHFAIAHYKSLAAKYPASQLAYQSLLLASESYAQLKDWQGAVNNYETIIEQFKSKTNVADVILQTAAIYHNELNKPDKAKLLLEQIIKDYPRTKFANAAQALLKGLQKK